MSLVSFKKRGQGLDQIMIYIMIAVVVLLIVLLGYHAISNGKERYDRSTLINFKIDFKSDLEGIKRNLGSSVMYSYNLPKSIEFVCFHDSSCPNNSCINYPMGGIENFDLVESMIEENENHSVILVPDEGLPIAFDMRGVDVRSEYCKNTNEPLVYFFDTVCVPVEDNVISVLLEGAGNRTIITPIFSKRTTYNSSDIISAGQYVFFRYGDSDSPELGVLKHVSSSLVCSTTSVHPELIVDII